MTPNYTCETCWCVVLKKFRTQHEAWHARQRHFARKESE